MDILYCGEEAGIVLAGLGRRKKKKRTHLVFGALRVKHCHQHLSVAIPARAICAEDLTKSGGWWLRRLSVDLGASRRQGGTNLLKNVPGGGEQSLWRGRQGGVAVVGVWGIVDGGHCEGKGERRDHERRAVYLKGGKVLGLGAEAERNVAPIGRRREEEWPRRAAPRLGIFGQMPSLSPLFLGSLPLHKRSAPFF